jgi:hypothetical protein
MEKYDKSSRKYICISCNYNTSKIYNYNKHLTTLKHQNATNNSTLAISGNNKIVAICPNYTCIYCNYTTEIKFNYDKHLLSEKHKKNSIIVNDLQHIETKHICNQCNKEYFNYNALWKHKKKCSIIPNDKVSEPLQNTFIPSNVINPELFMEVFRESKELQNVLIEQNKELQSKILELAKNQSIVNNNNNTTNNTQFNLQFFLNETCKDAMNIVDFVNSLQLTIDDFETTGKLGFVDGISRIFIKELKKLETEKLPIHCTDLKRETVYIKDNNIWEKENNEKQKLKWTIDRIAQLNLVQHHNWQQRYPVCIENNTKENEYFFKLAAVALGGKGEDEKDKYRDKIMKNVLKEVVLDKKSVVLK